MKIYLASSWRNALQPDLVVALRGAGHEVYDFRNPVPGQHGFAWRSIEPGWETWDASRFRAALAHPLAISGFALDIEALRSCEACVLLLPCGRSAHLEAGWAAGAGKSLHILLAGENEPELMYKMARLHLTAGELLLALAEPHA